MRTNRTTDNGGEKYFVTLYDDDTSSSAVLMITEKSEAGKADQEMLAEIETVGGSRVKLPRMDNGGGINHCRIRLLDQ